MRQSKLSLSVVLLASTCLAGLAHAQSFQTSFTPPVHSSIDERGVDLFSGEFYVSDYQAAVGPEGSGGLARVYYGNGLRDNYTGTITQSGSTYTVSIGNTSKTFTSSGATFTNNQGDGATLAFGTQSLIYTSSAGVVAVFSTTLAGDWPEGAIARITSLTLQDGSQLTYSYKNMTVTDGDGSLSGFRLQSITSTAGYQLKYNYYGNTVDNWFTLKSVVGINRLTDYCDPAADSCTGLTGSWPTASLSDSSYSTTSSVTDSLGRTTTYALPTGPNLTSTVTRPAGDVVTVATNANARVSSWSNGIGTWSYAYSDSGTTRTTTVTDPLGHTRVVTSDQTNLLLLSDTDGLGRTTSYSYDTLGRPTLITQPEGNSTAYTYDARGNVTLATFTPKSGSGLSAISISAGYDTTCSSLLTCNKPNWTRDALGNQTDYTYDTAHGGVLTVTKPAGASGVRPQTRYSYSQVPTYAKNSSGTVVQVGSIWALTGTSTCVTGSSCSGTSDEVKATISRSSTTNLAPTTATLASGTGSPSASTALTYDNVGNVLTVDGPLSGTSDTVRYRYDAARQVIGVIGPDPDGSGALKHRALRATYDADGRATIAELGTVASQSDTDWAAMSVLQQGLTKYDAIGRATHQALYAGGTIQSVTQVSYDNANRTLCSAVRMNAAVFGSWPNVSSLPASACSLGTEGSDGPDRISYATYDAADHLLKVTTGYGTSLQHDEAVLTYSANGKVATAADGKGNLTTYAYDGFDRLSQTRLPSPTTAGTSSSTDYLSYGYDAASRLTSERRRNGQTITYSYDALDRLTAKDAPATTYAYDNLNRLTTVTQNSRTVTTAYDALGQVTSQTEPLGTVGYLYDSGGRRQRVTWPDGFYATYDYDVLGETTAIKENGSTSLATYGYDDLGRRTSLTRGNGVTTTYGYDTASRLVSQTHDIGGTATGNDQTLGFGYNAAGQIKSRTSSNTAYAWGGHYAVDRTHGVNGLNQLTSSGSQSLSYDLNGNLTSDGVTTYTYDIDNKLTASNAGAGLSYDPLGRLYQTTTSAGVATRFIYDGTNLVGEYDSSGVVLRRYVPGPGTDEPLAWYEGSGTGDRRWTVADPQGSVVAVTNGAGASLFTNTYDEYGVPGSTNQGRFQYTGQAWLPEVGLYHYKARTYSPTLGRFLQTDPSGYEDGMNWYAYVGNDPVNFVDPTGLGRVCTSEFGTAPPGQAAEIILSCKEVNEPEFGDPSTGTVSGGGGEGSTEVSEIVVAAAKKKANPKKESRWTCAANLANKYSLAGLVGWDDSTKHPIGNALLGNTFSGIHDFARDFQSLNGPAFVQDLVLSGVGQGAPVWGALSKGSAGVVWKGAGGASMDALAGLAATGGTRAFAAGFATTVGWVKLGADATIWGVSYAYCREQ